MLEGAAETTVIVNLDGEPVEGATVTFTPQSGGRSAVGRTDATGTAKMGTSDTGDGVLPGVYAVAVLKSEVDPSSVVSDPQAYYDKHHRAPPPPKQTYLIPEKFSKPKLSGLSATVELGKANEVYFELKSED